MKRPLFVLLVLLLMSVVLPAAAQEMPRVVASTSIVADVAQRVAGDLLQVESLVPVGADAHAFEPAPDDAARVADADLLLVVGAGYEAFLARLIEALPSESTEIVVISNGVEILGFEGHMHDEAHEAEGEHAEEGEHEHHIGVLGADLECESHEHEEEGEHSETEGEAHDEHDHGACDPHVWMNPANVALWARNIADAFSTADPVNAETYGANAEAYAAQLEALDAELRDILAVVPEDRRLLVTNHEFMAYFAEAYGFEVIGTVLPAITSTVEVDPRTLADLIALIDEANAGAVFAEVSGNPQLAEIVAQEAGVPVVTNLYSETLSTADGPAATYIDLMRHNASVIAAALGGQ